MFVFSTRLPLSWVTCILSPLPVPEENWQDASDPRLAAGIPSLLSLNLQKHKQNKSNIFKKYYHIF